MASVRVRDKVAIQQNHRNPRFLENLSDGPIDRVLLWSELQRRKENSRHLLGDELTTSVGRLLFDVFCVTERTSPEQDVVTSVLRFGHPATDRFEDLSPAQFRNHQPECVPASCGV